MKFTDLRRRRKLLLIVADCLLLSIVGAVLCLLLRHDEPVVRIDTLHGFPTDEAGYELGVSACFAGAIDGKIVMAGGCNFPSSELTAPKRFYQGIYRAEFINDTTINWHKIGKLPQAAAYGVSVVYNNQLIVAGGCNNDGALADVYAIKLCGDSVQIEELPSLLFPTDNMAGACVGNQLFIVGGNSNGKPSSQVFALNLDALHEGWHVETTLPDSKPRVQPVCAAVDGQLFVWGGFAPATDEHQAEVFTTGFAYNPTTHEWCAVATPTNENGETLTLSGGAATNFDNGKIVCAGGVNKNIFLDAISGRYELVAPDKYLSQPAEWYRFNPYLLTYDLADNTWQILAENNSLARAGAAIVVHSDTLYYIGGELKPRVRTPEVVRVMKETPSSFDTESAN